MMEDEQLPPPLKWLQWRCGPELWPEHSADFPSSSLTEADATVLHAALEKIATDYGGESGSSAAPTAPAPKDFPAPEAPIEPDTPSSRPTSKPGTLTCTLLRAVGLSNADLWSQSDVYSKLWLVDQKNAEGEEERQEQRSTTIEDNNNPEWGTEFHFQVGDVTDCTLRYRRAPPACY